MEHRQIGFGQLLPTDKDSTESVHPAVGSFDHPTTCPEARFGSEALSFFPASSDVGREAKFFSQLANFGEVVALVHADPATIHGDRPGDLDGFYGLPDQFEVIAVGTVNDHSNGNSLCFGQEATFDTLLAPVRRISTRFFDPDKGALLIAPSIDSQLQSIPSI